MPRSERKTLSLTQMLTPEQLEDNRQAMFASWLGECEAMRLEFIEVVLDNLPSARDRTD